MNRKKHHQGFTLIEILASIVILGVLATIAAIAVVNVQKNMKETYYEKQRSYIILAAKDYFTTNRTLLPREIGGTKTVLLDELVKDNYIDPVYGYKKEECSKAETEVQVAMVHNGEYQYGVRLVCNGESSVTDRISPRINYTSDKMVARTISVEMDVFDTESGLLFWEYQLYKDDVEIASKKGLTDPKSDLILNETGVYRIEILAVDKQNNKSRVTTKNFIVDQIAPSCSVSGAPTGWTKDDVVLKGTCTDTGGSECAEKEITKVITSDTSSLHSPGTIMDNAGNETVCESVEVKLDKTAPSLTISGDIQADIGVSTDLMQGVTSSDEGGSGLKGVTISWNNKPVTDSTQLTKGTQIVTYQAMDNAGNVTTKTRNITVRTALGDIKRDKYVYIRYGSQLFVTYDNYSRSGASGFKAILDNTYQVSSFSSASCCDTGVCNYDRNNFTNNQMGTVLNNFLRTLPSTYSQNLVFARWDTGYISLDRNYQVTGDNTLSRMASSYTGLMSYQEFRSLQVRDSIPYIWSTVDGRPFWLSTLAFNYVGSNMGTVAVFFNQPRLGSNWWQFYATTNSSYSSAYNGIYSSQSNYVRPTVVFKYDTEVTSGRGTKANPYVVR